MDRIRFEQITTKYLKGEISPQEEMELLRAIESSEKLHLAFRKRSEEWNPTIEANPEADRKWNRIAAIITPQTEDNRHTATLPTPSSNRTLWLSIAAAILFLCISGISIYFVKIDNVGSSAHSDWQTILAKEGDQSYVLPDGTSVYMREGAELRFPETFETSMRKVMAKGELFFDVVHNSEQPFIVDASGLLVKVLGTSFSVSTPYNEDQISVILVDGKVSLTDTNQKELIQLSPNQKADYSVKDGHYIVSEVDSERLTSWRKGIITYDNASLDEIVHLIERTYKVSLSYSQPEKESQRFSGAFLKTQKLETVLQQTGKLTGTDIKPGQ